MTAVPVVLVLAPTVAHAAEPDLAGARLWTSDLPEGFTGLPDEHQMAQVATALAEQMGLEGVYSNVHAFGRDGEPPAEVVVSGLFGPVPPNTRRSFDVAARLAEEEPAMLLEQLAGAADGAPQLISGAEDVGAVGFGFALPIEIGEDVYVFDVVETRREAYLTILVVAHRQGEAATADVVALARLLDARLRTALGEPTFRSAGTLVPELTTHIPTPLDVSTDPTVVFANLVIAAVATVLFTAALQALNRALAEHEHDLQRVIPPAAWLARLQRRADALAEARMGRRADLLRLVGILLFYGVVFSLLEPGWNPFTITGLALLAYMTVAFGVVGLADNLAEWSAARHRGLDVRLSVRPALALLAVSSTAATRLFGIVPGVMLGTPDATPIADASLTEAQRRRLVRIGGMTLLVVGGGAWLLSLGTALAQRVGLSGAVGTLVAGLEAFLLVVFAVTVQNLFVQMLTLPGNIGAQIHRRHRWLWFGAFLATTFLFLHTLLNPRGDVAAALEEVNVRFFLGTVVVFVLVSLAIVLGFRRAERAGLLTPAPEPAPTLPGAPWVPAGTAAATGFPPGPAEPLPPPPGAGPQPVAVTSTASAVEVTVRTTAPLPAFVPVPAPAATPRPRRGLGLVLGALAAVVILTVVAVIVLAWETPERAEPGAGAVIAAPTSLVGTPATFTADPGSWSVTLEWQPAEAGSIRYVVLRDGETLAERLEGSRFVDTEVEPDRTYRYQVVALGKGDRSEAATVRLTTPALPVAQARLRGLFDTRIEITSHWNFTLDGWVLQHDFILRPTCGVGPCDTAVRITYVAPAPHGTLAWDGDRYTAELIDGSPVACEGVSDPTAVVVLDLQVTRADVVGGEWRATRITGTMEVTTSGFRSCGAGGWTAGVTGTLR